MRLKSLRKERPAFESEGAVINGNRLDLPKNGLKSAKSRPNTSFALPTSLYVESTPLILSSSDQTHEINTHSRSRQQIVIPIATQSSNLSSYQAIEAAYLEHGIRIRLSPTRTIQQSGGKSVNNLQRQTTFLSRNPSRTSSVLHYTTSNLDQHHDSRSFSALQQTSLHDFDQTNTNNISYAQSLQINEETHDDFLSPSIIASEQSHPVTPPEKIPITNDSTSATTTTLFDNDPDLFYMSSLLKQPSGDSFLDTMRRRVGLRGTFSIHRRPLTTNSHQTREKSPNMNRNSLSRTTTIAIIPAPSSQQIDKDILKHASRIRRKSQSKDYTTISPRKDTSPNANSSPKRNSTNKSLKSISLEPLEFLLSPAPHSSSLSAHDLPSIKKSSKTRKSKISTKCSKSAKPSIIEKENSSNFLSTEHSTYSSLFRDETLSLMRTSPLNLACQTNSFDSGCYERSSSSVDLQSLTSSSMMHITNSIPSTRLTNSAARRSNTNKKVSFYDEHSTVILTTATYV